MQTNVVRMTTKCWFRNTWQSMSQRKRRFSFGRVPVDALVGYFTILSALICVLLLRSLEPLKTKEEKRNFQDRSTIDSSYHPAVSGWLDCSGVKSDSLQVVSFMFHVLWQPQFGAFFFSVGSSHGRMTTSYHLFSSRVILFISFAI